MKKIILFSIIAAASIFMACKTRVEPDHVHEYTDTVVAPTCTAEGYTEHKCACGDVKTDTKVAAKGHSYKDTVVAPTCTDKGYTEHKCSACGDVLKDTETAALGHDISASTITTRPTITSKGIRASVCSRCSELINPVEEEKYDDEIDLSEKGLKLYIGQYEVTRAYYKEVMGADADPSAAYPCTASEGDARPVDGVDKAKAIAFCNALSKAKGLKPYYTEDGTIPDLEEKGYRLLTKDEWEKAALAGTTNNYAGTNGSLKNVSGTDAAKSGNVKFSVTIIEEDGTETVENKEAAIANVGDPELAKYAWTKYNIRTGEVENPKQYRINIKDTSAANNYGYVPYTDSDTGAIFKSSPWGYAAARGGLDDSQYGTHTVGTRLPNEWDLYDMTGNVSELVEDSIYAGGGIESNTGKLYIGHATYDQAPGGKPENLIKGFRICRNK